VATPGTDDGGDRRNTLVDAERAWGEPTAKLVLVVRAVLAAELHLRLGDTALEDLTQEVLRRALDGRERTRAGAPLRPWILGIARHVAADERRRQARLTTLDDPAAPAPLEGLRDPGRAPDELAQRAQMLAQLRASLAQLPETWRKAVLLFHVEDLSYQEIASELGVPLGTVATWIARGRAQLIALLGVGKEPQP
jgi:RNA polymerase sigma factor (sigma-70 family)